MEMPLWKTYCFWAQNALIFLTRCEERTAARPATCRKAVGSRVGAGAERGRGYALGNGLQSEPELAHNLEIGRHFSLNCVLIVIHSVRVSLFEQGTQ